MKASELRLNNWVWNDVQNLPVQVDIRILNQQYLADRGIGHNWHPIPLTEEILLKCGFENEVDDIDGEMYNIYFVTNTEYLIEYFYKAKEYIFTDDMGLKVSVSNIHQLQNLYYALTNEELEVKL